MKLKRFDDMLNENMLNEAKSPERKKIELEMTDLILGLLKKDQGLSRSGMISAIEKKLKGNKDAKKISRWVADKLVSDPTKSKNKITTKNIKGTVYFSIAEDKPKKETKKTSKKIEKFDEFEIDEKEAEKARETAEKDIEETRRKYNFSKDSDKQLKKKLDNKKWEDYSSEINTEISKRNKKK